MYPSVILTCCAMLCHTSILFVFVTGEVGNSWESDKITLRAGRGDLVFEGVTGTGYRGDIGLDEITLITTPCS